MECNKDEALRAKEIAEKKFLAKDFKGARKFAVKAQNLYPGLDGIPQMLATIDVYVAAENRVKGEANWYGILGVNPLVDEETVRRQYRKLALLLHPDKNKSVGAEGAFKHVSEAWSVLSDKSKKSAYDQRNATFFQQRVNPQNGDTQPVQNGFYNFAKSTASRMKVAKGNTTKMASSSAPGSSRKHPRDTFWTVCHRCRLQYEYIRMYLNQYLLCPNCKNAFRAVETAPPSASTPIVSTKWDPNLHGRSNSVPSTASSGHYSFQFAHAANVVQEAYEKVKRERKEAQAANKREEALRKRNFPAKRASVFSSPGHSCPIKRKRGTEDLGASRDSTKKPNKDPGIVGTVSLSGQEKGNTDHVETGETCKLSSTKGVSNISMRHLLIEKAKKEINKWLSQRSSAGMVKSAAPKEVIMEEKAEEEEDHRSVAIGARGDQSNSSQLVGSENKVYGEKSYFSTSLGYPDRENMGHTSYGIPEPDFHDFDKDRMESCFSSNQVWAAYDNNDAMPRFYAIIHDVISLNPFKIQISWLNSKTNSGLGQLKWVGSGLSKTCGDFMIGRQVIINSVNFFSHKVKWTRGLHGAIQIFPKRGEVWAIYRNWSPEWNELTEDEAIHKYDLVEVLEDYDDEQGVFVIPLVKVAGFKTVFHRHLSIQEIRKIPREELVRFSHHVPSYMLKGHESPNAPKGCWELDPAAAPLELLEVITDVNEIE